MSISLGPFLTCFITILFLTGYLYFILYYDKNIIHYGIKLLFVGIAFILLRTLVPVNFPFTVSIYFEKILRPLQVFFFFQIGNTPIMIFDICIVLWLAVSCYKLMKLLWQYIRFSRYLKPFLLKDWSAYPLLKDILQQCAPSSLRIAVMPIPVSPAIFGFRKPILILPNVLFTKEELTHIVLHEVMHYRNHDLWLNLLLNICCCFQWYNPFMYLLRKKLTLAFELSNDEVLLKDYSSEQKVSYAECILKISRFQGQAPKRNSALSFVETKNSSLKQRIDFVLSPSSTYNTKKFMRFALHSLFIGSVLLLSLIFVPEPISPTIPVEDNAFTITRDNAYLLEQNGSYLLYVNDEYITSFSRIPENFKDLKIK